MYQTIQYSEEGAIGIIQLHRPEKKNALNTEMRHELESIFRDVGNKQTIRAIVVTGGTDVFCAGADIGEIRETKSAEDAYNHAREFQLLFDKVESLPQPLIAAVS